MSNGVKWTKNLEEMIKDKCDNQGFTDIFSRYQLIGIVIHHIGIVIIGDSGNISCMFCYDSGTSGWMFCDDSGISGCIFFDD